jgi:hypothetical protein
VGVIADLTVVFCTVPHLASFCAMIILTVAVAFLFLGD